MVIFGPVAGSVARVLRYVSDKAQYSKGIPNTRPCAVLDGMAPAKDLPIFCGI